MSNFSVVKLKSFCASNQNVEETVYSWRSRPDQSIFMKSIQTIWDYCNVFDSSHDRSVCVCKLASHDL